jgi:[ribosomal protein S5]-alanine N-acetyltransferase
MKKAYETDRLLLKVLDGGSTKEVLEYLKRNDTFLREWEPEKPEGYFTPEYQMDQLDLEFTEIEKGSMLKLWIFRKDVDGRPIGSVNFGVIVRGAFQSCFMGYRLDELEINKGYMTEAAGTGIGIMFNEYKLHRIEANIMPRNARSMAVVRKLGFHEEGLARNYLKINGKWEDHVHMALLNEKFI